MPSIELLFRLVLIVGLAAPSLAISGYHNTAVRNSKFPCSLVEPGTNRGTYDCVPSKPLFNAAMKKLTCSKLVDHATDVVTTTLNTAWGAGMKKALLTEIKNKTRGGNTNSGTSLKDRSGAVKMYFPSPYSPKEIVREFKKFFTAGLGYTGSAFTSLASSGVSALGAQCNTADGVSGVLEWNLRWSELLKVSFVYRESYRFRGCMLRSIVCDLSKGASTPFDKSCFNATDPCAEMFLMTDHSNNTISYASLTGAEIKAYLPFSAYQKDGKVCYTMYGIDKNNTEFVYGASWDPEKKPPKFWAVQQAGKVWDAGVGEAFSATYNLLIGDSEEKCVSA